MIGGTPCYASILSLRGWRCCWWLAAALARRLRVPTDSLYATLRGSHVDVGCDINRCALDAAREPRNLFFGRSFGTKHRDEKKRALREGTGSAGGGSLAHHRGSLAQQRTALDRQAGEVDAS